MRQRDSEKARKREIERQRERDRETVQKRDRATERKKEIVKRRKDTRQNKFFFLVLYSHNGVLTAPRKEIWV